MKTILNPKWFGTLVPLQCLSLCRTRVVCCPKPLRCRYKAIIIAIILAPFINWAQSDASIDLILGVDYSFRNLNVTNDNLPSPTILENRNQETSKLNWRMGFNYNHRVAPRLFLKTGLRLASIGYQSGKTTDLRWPSESDGNGGWTPDPTLPREIQYATDYLFFEIPFIVRFESKPKKISLFYEAGILPSIYLTTEVTTKTNLGTSAIYEKNNNSNSFNDFQLVSFLSFGANYELSEKWKLFGQPAFRYHLTALNKNDAPIKEHLWSVGLEFGVRRRL